MPDEEAVIVATARSAIGRANKGSLVDYRADELMATILNALMDKVPEVDRADIFDIICGNVAQSGETGFSLSLIHIWSTTARNRFHGPRPGHPFQVWSDPSAM